MSSKSTYLDRGRKERGSGRPACQSSGVWTRLADYSCNAPTVTLAARPGQERGLRLPAAPAAARRAYRATLRRRPQTLSLFGFRGSSLNGAVGNAPVTVGPLTCGVQYATFTPSAHR
eukprot:162008-Chlamydomonas_euryale.AAC.6